MDPTESVSEEILRQVIDKFWEVFPTFWQQVRAHIRKVAIESFSLSVEQFHILRHIRKGQNTISEIAEAQHISRPGVSQAVDALVNRGLIQRTQSLQDRRHIHLDLTAEGNALLDSVFENTRRWMMGSFASLSEAELQNLIRAMESLKKVCWM